MIYTPENYRHRIDSLFERHQSVQSVGFGKESYKPGLEGMRELDAALGRPSEKFRSIHVAGTNGKGTVCSMLASALSATGLHVGLYTSPHISDFRERMKIISPDGCELIPEKDVWDFLELGEPLFDGRSFFEITTAMAFHWFAAREVDIAVIETGLGGRLDSTNIIVPEISIITGIGLDHCAILGDTRALIATEKAGIFKPGVPALVWADDPETTPSFLAAAGRTHSPLFFATDFTTGMDDATSLSARDMRQDAEGQDTGWAALNIRTVLAALELIGVEADRDALLDFSARTGLRGRWETHELPEATVIMDIGHNPPALRGNFARLSAMGRPLVIVYGIMADKDLDGIAPMMPGKYRGDCATEDTASGNDAVYIPVAPATVRALPAAALAERLTELRPDLNVTAPASSVADGLRKAFALAHGPMPAKPVIYVGGSTFVVAEAIDAIG